MVIIDTLLPEDPEVAAFYQQMETMRDPTHVQAYTEAEWLKMIGEAGFKVEKTAVFPKTHDFQNWAKRAGLNPSGVEELNRFFMDAPDKVHDYFQIDSFAGDVEAYTDKKLLIYATRIDTKAH